jgi:hypothetical protein
LPTVKTPRKQKKRAVGFLSEFASALETIFGYLFVFLKKAIGVIAVILSVALIIALILSLTGKKVIHIAGEAATYSFSLHDFSTFFFENSDATFLIQISLVLLIGIPLFSMFYMGIRTLFNLKKKWKNILPVLIHPLDGWSCYRHHYHRTVS